MSAVSAGSVRELVLDRLAEGLERAGRGPESVSDETDFFAERLIDSFGLLDLIVALEERFGVTIDFESIEADDFTMVGPFCRYVEELTRA
jgi:acyl carrier protein